MVTEERDVRRLLACGPSVTSERSVRDEHLRHLICKSLYHFVRNYCCVFEEFCRLGEIPHSVS